MIQFNFSEVKKELIAITSLSKDYIDDASSHFVLPRFATLLSDIQNDGGTGRWEIPDSKPLVTRRSIGEYEPGGKRGLRIYAAVSCLWEISCVPTKPKKAPASEFAISGIASTRVRIWREFDNGTTEQYAMWRMEIGDSAAPGCHFHVQILGEVDTGQFPKSLPVPRLPGLPATPLLAIEYVLGELFQDHWKHSVGQKSDALQMWRGIQGERFRRFFSWQDKALEQLKLGSPWTSLKFLKPEADLFTRS